MKKHLNLEFMDLCFITNGKNLFKLRSMVMHVIQPSFKLSYVLDGHVYAW